MRELSLPGGLPEKVHRCFPGNGVKCTPCISIFSKTKMRMVQREAER